MERHSRLLNSNAAPEPAEVAAIREDINARNKAIDQLEITLQELELDADVEKLEADHRRVDERRERVQEELNHIVAERDQLCGLLISIDRFPVEILSQIFVAVHDHPAVRNKVWQVAALCLVCRQWWNVAMCTARLWCELKLSAHDLNGSRCDANKLSRRFARSGTAARNLELFDFRCRSSHWDGANDLCDLVEGSRLVEILAHGPLLHGLFLSRISPRCLQRLARKLKDMQVESRDISPWNTLKHLTIHIGAPSGLGMPGPPPLADMLADLPFVPSFCLFGRWDDVELYDQPRPSNTILETVPTLSISDFTLQSAFKILAVSSNVHTLTMNFANYYDFGPRQPIVLQKLRVLRLGFWSCREVTAFLQVLHTPHLGEFCVTFHPVEEEEAYLGSPRPGDEAPGRDPHLLLRNGRLALINGLISFLHQSEATVHTLLIENFKFPSGALEKLLFSLPSLTHLTLKNVVVDRFPFRPTHELPSDTYLHLLPHLESLCLTNITGDDSCYEGVCDFFGHRATNGLGIKNIKKLTFEMDRQSLREFDALPANALRKAVTGLRKLGVDVYVRFNKWS